MQNVKISKEREQVIEDIISMTDEELIRFLIYLKKEIEENEEYASLKEDFMPLFKNGNE